MSDHISTEKAERVAGEVKETARRLWKWDQWLDDAAAADRAAAALRSLAAERDAQTDEIERLRKALRWIESVSREPSRDHWPVALDRILAHARAALGENQP